MGRRLLGIGLGVAALAVFRFLSGRPELAEQVAGTGLLPAVTRSLSLVTGAVPFAVDELVVVAVIGRQIVGVWRERRVLREGHDRPARSVLRGGLRLGQDAGVLVALFVLLWGVQYARPGLEARLGLDLAGQVPAEELEVLARAAVQVSNRLYVEIHGTDDAGTPTPAPAPREILPELERAWERVVHRHDLPLRATAAHGPPKRFMAGRAIHRFGVAGMYFPFTGEALVLHDLPGVTLPRDLAHEMAHQRGFAAESDANTLAFLVAREADDPRIRYAGYVFLQEQLIAALALQAPRAARDVARGVGPGVRRDLDDRARYWRTARGWTRSVGTTLNDAMLRAHRVPGGIANYRGSTWVFVALARQEGLEALLPPARAAAS